MASKAIDPYKPIPGRTVKFSSSAPFVPTYVTSNLTQNSDPNSTYAARVRGRHLLLENPIREGRQKLAAQEKRERRKREKEKKGKGVGRLSNSRKDGGLWRLDKSQARYDRFVPLHHLWLGYMSELLNLPHQTNVLPNQLSTPSSASMHAKLVKADFHGSIVSVRNSKNPALIGLSGIVVHETENAFRVITTENVIKLLPKRNSIFVFSVPYFAFTTAAQTSTRTTASMITQGTTSAAGQIASETHDDLKQPSPAVTVHSLPHLEFELYGNQFTFRATDRASKKFKHKETIEL